MSTLGQLDSLRLARYGVGGGGYVAGRWYLVLDIQGYDIGLAEGMGNGDRLAYIIDVSMGSTRSLVRGWRGMGGNCCGVILIGGR